jgi:alpha-glucosidase
MNQQKIYLTLSIIALFFGTVSAQKKLELKSPDGAIKVSFDIGDHINYSVAYHADDLLVKNTLALQLNDETLGTSPKLISSKTTAEQSIIKPYISLKYASVVSNYNKQWHRLSFCDPQKGRNRSVT